MRHKSSLKEGGSYDMMQPCPNTLMKSEKTNHTLGWIGTSLVLLGYYLNANMYISSWLVWAVGNLFVGKYCLDRKAYPTAIMSFVLIILNIYGYFNWST